MAKITKATFKAFIKKNLEKGVYILSLSSFDGMSDMVENIDNPKSFKIESVNFENKNTFGVNGIWLVGGSRDRFKQYDTDFATGIEVYNSCGNFIVFTKK